MTIFEERVLCQENDGYKFAVHLTMLFPIGTKPEDLFWWGILYYHLPGVKKGLLTVSTNNVVICHGNPAGWAMSSSYVISIYL